MKDTDIEKALSAAQKRELSRSFAGYVDGEIRALCAEEARTVARKWVNANKDWLHGEIEAACKKQAAKAVKNLVVEIGGRW